MASASATQKPNNVKDKKHTSRASSVSKTEPESPTESGSEPAYLKELQKSLRNAVKKLNATAKVDAILAENPGKSLDELVEDKKINADQKAQALKKPALQAAVAQIEEQIGHYKEVAGQYEAKLVSQKAALDKAHQEELEAVRANAIADATETSARVLREQLLDVSKFLCAAANLRRAGDESAEGRAFEAVLYQVYGGSRDAVTSMVKLIEGSDEKLQDIEGEALDLTYGDVKQACSRFAPAEEPETTTEATPASDPTLANAGLTELEETSISAEVAAQAETTPQPDQIAPPAQTSTGDGANPVADSMTSSATTEGWVEVPRDPAETETGLQATPANTENAATEETAAKGNNSGRGRGRQGHGRGRGDGNRGRGRGGRAGDGRGDGRGRGRGRGGKRGGANGTPAVPAPSSGDKQ